MSYKSKYKEILRGRKQEVNEYLQTDIIGSRILRIYTNNKETRTCKSPDLDNLPNELLTYGPRELMKELTTLFQSNYMKGNHCNLQCSRKGTRNA